MSRRIVAIEVISLAAIGKAGPFSLCRPGQRHQEQTGRWLQWIDHGSAPLACSRPYSIDGTHGGSSQVAVQRALIHCERNHEAGLADEERSFVASDRNSESFTASQAIGLTVRCHALMMKSTSVR
jgi:hypothetical protein